MGMKIFLMLRSNVEENTVIKHIIWYWWIEDEICVNAIQSRAIDSVLSWRIKGVEWYGNRVNNTWRAENESCQYY